MNASLNSYLHSPKPQLLFIITNNSSIEWCSLCRQFLFIIYPQRMTYLAYLKFLIACIIHKQKTTLNYTVLTKLSASLYFLYIETNIFSLFRI